MAPIIVPQICLGLTLFGFGYFAVLFTLLPHKLLERGYEPDKVAEMKRSIGWPLVVNSLRMGGSLMAIIAGVMLYDGFFDDDMDNAFVLGLIVSTSFTIQFVFRAFFEEQVKISGGRSTLMAAAAISLRPTAVC